jgi:putative transposase
MPRRPRIVIPGVVHHITQRGNNRQPVFLSSAHRRLYLDLLRHHAQRNAVSILGYCLMPNHIHLVAVPEHEDSLARTLGRVHSEYALVINRAEDRSGHLWQNRFFSCPMDEAHLFNALRYTDLNPVRSGLAAQAWDWRWSSALAHSTEGACDPVLHADWVEHCGCWNYPEWREMLRSGMSDPESGAVRDSTRRGAPLGSEEFVARLEALAGRRLRVLPRGRPPAHVSQGSLLADEEQNASVPF